MEKGSKFSDKFKEFITKSQNSIKFSKLKPKAALNLLHKFKNKDKFKATQLGDIHKGRGVSTFQDKFSVSRAISTISAPTYAAKNLAKGVVKEGAKFSVAIFDNSPGFVKSWVRSFSGYGLAVNAARERFDSLPEVVKIKARRSVFEVFLVIIVGLAFGLGFGLHYGLKKNVVLQVVRTQSESSNNTTWNPNSSFPETQGSGSFTWLLSQTAFLDFNPGYSSRSSFYVDNFYGGDVKSGANPFYFTGVDVPSMGVSFTNTADQNNNVPVPNPSYLSPGSPYKHYAPIAPANTTRAHFVKYSSFHDISKVIRINKAGQKQATNSTDDLYRNNLLNSWGLHTSHFALYTLSKYSGNAYVPLSLTFASITTDAPKIVENVSFIVTNCNPSSREVSNNQSDYNVEILLTQPLVGSVDPSNPNYQRNFGGVIFANQSRFGFDWGGSKYFSQSLEFKSK